MPTAPINTYTGTVVQPAIKPELAMKISVKLATGTYAAGQVLGEVTATPGTFKTYASANTDGSQNPTAILPRACAVDASGNITFGAQTGGDEWGITFLSTDVWISGSFFTQDLVGLDANALGKLGSLKQGTVTLGIINAF